MFTRIRSLYQKGKYFFSLFVELLPLSLLAGFTGILLYFVCTPNDLHYLQWFAFLPMFFACNQASWKRNFYLGWCTGLVANCFIFYWMMETIIDYAGLPNVIIYPLGAVALFAMSSWGAVLYGFLGASFPLIRKTFPKLWIFILPAGYTFLEFFFPNIFPYFQGCGQFKNLPILQLASVAGASGITFLILGSNCVFYECIQVARQLKWKPFIGLVAGLALVLLAVHFWGQKRIESYQEKIANTPKMKVAMVQSGMTIRQNATTPFQNMLKFYVDQSRIAQKNGAKFIIWPESAMNVRVAPEYVEAFHQHIMQRVFTNGRVDLVYGGNWKPPVGDRYNTAFFLDRHGKRDYYAKMTLVPFGEYTPGGHFIPPLRGKLSRGITLAPGNKRKIFELGYGDKKKFPFASIICYEAIFHRKVLEFINDGARLLVNVTVDSWFNGSNEHQQHLMLASFCSIQFGVGMLRSVDSGITAYIDPLGQVHNPGPILKEFLWEGEVPLIEMETPVRKYGFWFPYVCLLYCLIVFGFHFLQQKKKNSATTML